MTQQKDSQFDVVIGIDMETDIGSFSAEYEGVKHGTPRLLSIMKRHDVKAFFKLARIGQYL